MSLNEILLLIKNVWISNPLRVFDYILIFAFVGFVIEEASYAFSIVFRRSLILCLSAFSTLILYRLLTHVLDQFSLPLGILNSISLVAVWVCSFGIFMVLLRKRFFEGMHIFTRIERPVSISLSAVGFLTIAFLVVHVFVSFPFSKPLREFIGNAYFSRIIIDKTFSPDMYFQKILLAHDNQALHLFLLEDGSKSRNLHILVSSAREEKSEKERVLNALNTARTHMGRSPLYEEEFLSNSALILNQKYISLGELSNKEQNMANILTERGVRYSKSYTIVIFTDSPLLISKAVSDNFEARQNFRNLEFAKIGISVVSMGNWGYLASVVLTN